MNDDHYFRPSWDGTISTDECRVCGMDWRDSYHLQED